MALSDADLQAEAFRVFPDDVTHDYEPPPGVEKHPLGRIITDRTNLRFAFLLGAQYARSEPDERVKGLVEALQPFADTPIPPDAKDHYAINYRVVTATYADVKRAREALARAGQASPHHG